MGNLGRVGGTVASLQRGDRGISELSANPVQSEGDASSSEDV